MDQGKSFKWYASRSRHLLLLSTFYGGLPLICIPKIDCGKGCGGFREEEAASRTMVYLEYVDGVCGGKETYVFC